MPPRPKPEELLKFRPWMLAAAVIMACLLGIAIMEDVRSTRELWARNDAATRR